MLQKKSLGQHFLHDPKILGKIAEAANLTPADTVLEVGPGEGTLTRLLLAQAGKVIAVEKDDRLIPILGITFEKEIRAGKLELVHGDILEFPISNFPACAEAASAGRQFLKKPYKVVANLPYYITGEFLRTFLSGDRQPSQMTLLLQKEVAKRIVASEKKESILSISIKVYGEPRYIDTVKAGSFVPPPSIDSAILNIERISKTFFNTLFCHSLEKGNPESERGSLDSRFRGNDNEARFFALLKKGFAHPRKLLSSNLGVSPDFLRERGVPEKARAETLTIDDWKRLTASYTATRTSRSQE